MYTAMTKEELVNRLVVSEQRIKELEKSQKDVSEEIQHKNAEIAVIKEELENKVAGYKMAEGKLRLNEARCRLVIEAQTEFVVRFLADTSITFVNEACCRYFNKSRKELIGKNFINLVNEENFDITKKFLEPANYQNPVSVFESRIKILDGEIRWLEWVRRAVFDQNEQLIEYQAVGRDITERKYAEEKIKQQNKDLQNAYEEIEAMNGELQESQKNLIEVNNRLRESEERLGLALWGADEGIWDWNIPAGEIYYNEQIASMLGYARGEMTNKIENWNILTHPDDLKKNKLLLKEHWSKIPDKYEREFRMKAKSGEWIWILESAKIVERDQQGNPIRVTGTHRDITHRKKIEEKIKYLSFNDSLTGTYNRNFFDEEMKRLDVKRQLPLSIIMGDVNGLKLVNDAFGHNEGDKLLIQITNILKKSCREEDIIARWGGDEFIILLPRTDENIAYLICDRIRKACSNASAAYIQPSIALGVAVKRDKRFNIQDVLSKAEDNMYRNKLLESKSVRNSIISSLEATLHEKTLESSEHTRRLQGISVKFADILGLTNDETDRLQMLAKLHDIGKIGIPNEILSKKGPLSQEEWEIIKKHSEIGYHIIQSSDELSAVAEEILAHHERWDGKGYPKGLKGQEIPFLSRLIAIIDAYDVMTSERSYKQIISHSEALEEIKKCSSSQFDPYLVESFTTMFT